MNSSEDYSEPLKSIITFVAPVGVMMTIPVKAVLGLVSLSTLLAVFLISSLLFSLSLRAWRFA